MGLTAGARIAVSGASGFLGAALVESLRADGVEVLRLVRREATGADEIFWNPETSRIDAGRLEGVHAVVHLAGESIAGVWSHAKKTRIVESRTAGTRLLSTTLANLDEPPHVLISASAVGYYGNAGEATLTEDDPPGDDFLARVCVAWEGATGNASRAGIRVVNPRFGLILDPSGGALKLMLPAFRFGLAAELGNGRQWMSWVSLADAVAILHYCLETADLEGPVNAVAPEPIRNEDFTSQLASALHRPNLFSAPRFLLKATTGGDGRGIAPDEPARGPCDPDRPWLHLPDSHVP